MKFLLEAKKVVNLLFLIMIFSLMVGCNSSDNKVDISSDKAIENTDIDLEEEDTLDDSEDAVDYEDSDDSEEAEIQSSEDYSDSEAYNEEENEEELEEEIPHYGERVYVAKGNNYYHKISNCKYLEGAPTDKITLDEYVDKHECNCFENPVEYREESHHSNKKHHGDGGHSSKEYVYIARGNRYYHKSSSCKHLDGASTEKVDLNDVGGKYPCNCIKY